MKLYLIFIPGIIAFTGCVSNSTTAEKPVQETVAQKQNGTETGLKTITSADAKTLLREQPEVVILDVRTPEEFKNGHLKNAVLINKNAPHFEAQINALDKNKTYLVYCAVGGRSGQATEYMEGMGFKNLYDATEGFASLKRAEVPVE